MNIYKLRLIIIVVSILFSHDLGVCDDLDITRCDLTVEERQFDGITLTVHYNEEDLKSRGLDPKTHSETVLKKASSAYKEIVNSQGFDSPGFALSNPDKDYCYEYDRTIDIYLTEPEEGPVSAYYEIEELEGAEYSARILLPISYRGRKIDGSLMHELLHIITYSYNKNIEPWSGEGGNTLCYAGADWYVEGLARYFETLGGAYENFFSKGYIKRLKDRVIISQGGSNFFMSHPDQPLKEARYDFSLFWAYMDMTYGMKKIEELSRKLRFVTKGRMEDELPGIISQTFKKEFSQILKEFALAVYFKDFNLSIKKGLDNLNTIDLASLPPFYEKEMPSWSSNFIQLDLDKDKTSKAVRIKSFKEGGKLYITAVMTMKETNKAYVRDLPLTSARRACVIDLEGARKYGGRRIGLIITNGTSEEGVMYRITRN
jgi:hypothetical protein